MRLSVCVLLTAVCVTCAAPARAQFKDGEPSGTKLGQVRVQRWRAGLTVEAVGGACKGIVGYVPLPAEWPEQDVETTEEDVPADVKISYEVVEGVKLMLVKIPQLPANEKVRVTVTVKVRRHALLPPENTDGYVVPDLAKLARPLRQYLMASPKIETRDARVRALAKEAGADKEKAWEKVEAIYDAVREKVKFKTGDLKGAAAALKDGFGDCEDITSAFVAACRAAGIPARTVWVPGHCYPEFYLEDKDGKGHWFPCEAAGKRNFGGIAEARPILEKGDNFRPPWNRRIQQRYMSEYLNVTPTPGGGQPKVTFIRDQLGM
jgi:hypothetical protein